MVQTIDVINRTIITLFFLIGFLSGGALVHLVHCWMDDRDRKKELEDE